MEDSSSPQSTPQTPAGMATSAEDSIAQSEGSVNTDEGLIYETLVDMGVHKAAAQSLARQFDAADGLSAEVYAKGVGESFLYGMVDEINRIQELFADGLAEAGARYKVLHGQKNSASEGDARSEDGVRHSFRDSKNGMANDSLRSYNNELRNIIENQGNMMRQTALQL